jgi:hypothetical protein
MGSRFGQDVEPAGKYMTIGNINATNFPHIESGKTTFQNPLVLDWGGGYGEETNWKNVLSRQFDGKTGKELSQAIRNKGYDGIITIGRTTNNEPYISEMVDIRMF